MIDDGRARRQPRARRPALPGARRPMISPGRCSTMGERGAAREAAPPRGTRNDAAPEGGRDMEEVVPVLSGIVIGLLTHRLSPAALRAVCLGVLTAVAGV